MTGVLSSGIVVIDDSADAGSRSTVEALKTLAETAGDTRRSIAVLGELAGAGSDARDEHDRIGRIVVRLNISQLVVVGAGARHLAAAAGLEGSWDGESVLVGTAGEAYDLVRAIIREGDVVLVKVPGLAARLVTATSGVLR
jgi:UDP-N-acetylmuramoyl-tripeptide--D-alanyl-D-alanine ligase